jgi:FkbM family methyltransferase
MLHHVVFLHSVVLNLSIGMKYSQNNEEEVILNYFDGKIGKFLDIGGYNPFSLSNTRKLVEIGWKGIYVEPSPVCFSSFEKVYKDSSDIQLFNCALGSHNGKVDFYDSQGDAISTLDLGHKDKWEKGSAIQYKKITVDLVSTEEFFLKWGNDIDFLSLDTESTNIQIFDQIPSSFWDRVSLFCIEHDSKIDYIQSKLRNFRQLLVNPENLILGK